MQEKEIKFIENFILPIEIKVSRKEEIARKVFKCLQQDFRMSMKEMSRRTDGVAISTIHDYIKLLRKHYDIKLLFIPKKEKVIK